MHLSMHYVKFLISAFIHVCVHGGYLPVCLVLVASSSPIGESRTLQIGIRAHVAEWASTGCEDGVTEEALPSPR